MNVVGMGSWPVRILVRSGLIGWILLAGTAWSRGANPPRSEVENFPGQNVVAVALPADGTWLMATDQPGGLLRSRDSGHTWPQETSPFETAFIYHLEATASGEIVVSTSAGLFVAAGPGGPWKRKTTAPVRIAGTSPGGERLIAPWNGGVYRLADKDWVRQDTGLPSGHVTALTHGSAGELVVGLFEGGLHRRSSAGWRPLGDARWPAGVLCSRMSSTGTWFAGCWRGGLHRLAAGTLEWRGVEGLPRDATVAVLASGPSGSLLAGTWGAGLLASVDDGQSWQQSIPATRAARIQCLAASADGTVLAGTWGQGLLVSTDGGRSFRSSVTARPVRSLSRIKAEQLVMSVVGLGLGVSDDAGTTWRRLEGPAGGEATVVAGAEDGSIAAVTDGEKVFCSLDGGKTWKARPGPGTEIAQLAVVSGEDLILATRGQGIHRSRAADTPWTRVLPDADFGLDLHLPASDPWLVATDRGVSLSIDGGKTWKDHEFGSAVRGVTWGREGELLAAASNGLHLSRDHGESWAPVDLAGGLPAMYGVWAHPTGVYLAEHAPGIEVFELEAGGRPHVLLRCLEGRSIVRVVLTRSGAILVGTDRGLLRSRDVGQSWEELTVDF